METKILGVLGGLGPMATAYYLELMIKMTDAATDQEHLQSIVMNFPTVPDRTAFILYLYMYFWMSPDRRGVFMGFFALH